VLHASDSCGGELVGAPLFLTDDVVSAPPWWWGWGGAGACCWLRGGASSCIGPLLTEVLRKWLGVCYYHDEYCAAGLVLIRAKAFTDKVSGDGGAAHWASFFPAGGTIAGHRALAAPKLEVKTLSFGTCDGGAYGVVPFLEASHLELDLTRGSGIWLLGGVARMRQQLGCARSVLAGRCKGAMVVGSLGFVRMVLW
jgi:hypothetical protein